jgi:hypothetical protein
MPELEELYVEDRPRLDADFVDFLEVSIARR